MFILIRHAFMAFSRQATGCLVTRARQLALASVWPPYLAMDSALETGAALRCEESGVIPHFTVARIEKIPLPAAQVPIAGPKQNETRVTEDQWFEFEPKWFDAKGCLTKFVSI